MQDLRAHMRLVPAWLVLLLPSGLIAAAEREDFFSQRIAPILQTRCLECHNGTKTSGGLDLTTRATLLAGGDQGPAIVPGQAAKSVLVEMVSGEKPEMPKEGPPLSSAQLADLKRWIDEGAVWPVEFKLGRDVRSWEERLKLWSLQPLSKPAVPQLEAADQQRARTPIDHFVLQKLRQQGLTPSPEADRRTLIRRVYFDLLGLPPAPEDVDRFVRDADPQAYENLVQKLLDSPHYGERWARHWLDVVHYGDTHGYDKDKVRPNAWPYRDYVIRALNEDKPYGRFVEEQVAGDVLYPETRDGIVALGFLAAGPWDFVGHVELREGTLDKAITRNLDRDDMVSTVMNTFTSLTVQCARCHDHKFDPLRQEDYYRLQAVFAAVDRADRPYDADPRTPGQRAELHAAERRLLDERGKIEQAIASQSSPELKQLDDALAAWAQQEKRAPKAEFGYHSAIMPDAHSAKWVQVDLGESVAVEYLVLAGCHDTFNQIGEGFGFPRRFKIELSDDAEFRHAVTVADRTQQDVPNPGVRPQVISLGGKRGRYVRVTATKLALRANDYIFALGELAVFDAQGKNLAAGKPVTALDSIEAPPRWQKSNLVDGYYYDAPQEDVDQRGLFVFARRVAQREALRAALVDADTRASLERIERELREIAAKRNALPPRSMVYAAATEFEPVGSFTPTRGKPRPIHILRRGSEKQPLEEVGPGTVACVAALPAQFELPSEHAEGERRAALARWLVHPENPLTWRSIVNRVWQYHFGRGIVETANDFGHMGAAPTHPELLDFLASEFRDGGTLVRKQSLKDLHRAIVTSAVYRQASQHHAANAQKDEGNRYLWRMNRRRLEAEAIRDAVLAVSGKLNSEMYGPGFRAFGFKDDHSPHYLYNEHDPDDTASQRRSIYRFIVRSVPEPFMETLDCADPSLLVERRNETITALQALALLNNKFMVRMAEHFAARVERLAPDTTGRVVAAFRLAVGREPSPEEMQVLLPLVERQGLSNLCRLIFNSNEFCFVD